jgi:hypothetical protein
MRNTSETGAPKFAEARKIHDPDQPILSIAAGDFDQDGKLDVVAQTTSGSLNLLSQAQ